MPSPELRYGVWGALNLAAADLPARSSCLLLKERPNLSHDEPRLLEGGSGLFLGKELSGAPP